MKNTRALCQTAVVAALYVALTTLNPLSWGAIQFRVANMLCALPFKDKKYAPAVLLGIAIANATSPFGPVDVAFGLMAEGAALALQRVGAFSLEQHNRQAKYRASRTKRDSGGDVDGNARQGVHPL